jgi:hypothetical protein
VILQRLQRNVEALGSKTGRLRESLYKVLSRDNYSRIVVSPTMRRVIKGMLDIDFNRRISPHEVISLL